MEQTIETLLNDFEAGRMNRRQLIKSLAMVASVAAPATALAQGAPAKAPWKTVHLDHISYSVTDYKRSAAFYSSLMGWEIANDNGTNQATLKIGDVGEIIIRNARRPDGAPAAGGPGQPSADHRRDQPHLLRHRAVGHRRREGRAREAWAQSPRPDMVGENFKSWHVLDPDGWDLQISNQTSGCVR